MDDSLHQGIISLIKCALKSENGELPQDFYDEKYISFAKEHQITNIIYEGALLCGADAGSNVMKALFARSCKNLLVCENQKHEINAVCDALEEKGIKHLPVKGAVIREVYPKSDMREMSDADILIHPEDHSAISEVMLALGFEETQESVHEFIFKKGKITVEMHKCLIPETHDELASYFADPWAMAQPVENKKYRFALSPIDHYIYIFVHLAKHYIDGGVGVKHITDMFVLRDKNTYDEGYILSVLADMGLDKFYKNIIKVIDAWFYNAPSDDVVQHITNVIVTAGAYGTYENHVLSQALQEKKTTKFQAFMKVVFPPVAEMKFAYPILQKHPCTLPFVWVYRWGAVLLGKRGNIAAVKAKVNCVDAQKIEDYKDALTFVGLDPNEK